MNKQIEYTNTAEPKRYMAYLKEALKKDYAGHTKSVIVEDLKTAKRAEEEKRKQKEKEQKATEQAKWERLTQKYHQLPKEEQERLILKITKKQ